MKPPRLWSLRGPQQISWTEFHGNGRHCEERRDEAIHLGSGSRLDRSPLHLRLAVAMPVPRCEHAEADNSVAILRIDNGRRGIIANCFHWHKLAVAVDEPRLRISIDAWPDRRGAMASFRAGSYRLRPALRDPCVVNRGGQQPYSIRGQDSREIRRRGLWAINITNGERQGGSGRCRRAGVRKRAVGPDNIDPD